MNQYYKDRQQESGLEGGISGLCFLGIIIILIACSMCNAEVPDKLLDAIAKVESNNNPNALGDYKNGTARAVGAYQLWKIYVDDVNRILGERRYDYASRLNSQKSRDMVRIYLNHYATQARLGHIPTLEDMARIHNGSGNGWKKKCTQGYWLKIKKELEK